MRIVDSSPSDISHNCANLNRTILAAVRYRAEFGALGWCTVGLACFVLILWMDGLRSMAADSLALGLPVLSLQQILSHIFIYWEVGPEGLCERRYWRVKSVAWDAVTHVGAWAPNANYLIVDHAQPGSGSDRGTIVAQPEDRAGFISDLQKYAPKADFEV
jgi:hypothetical protein